MANLALRSWLLRFGAAAVVTALTPTAGSAAVTACLTDEAGSPLRRVWVEHLLTSVMTDGSGCLTFPSASGPIDVRVHAHNPVVRMDDGGNLTLPVSQVVRLRDNATVAITAQSPFFRLAEDLRKAYNRGLREFTPWGGEFAASATRTSPRIIRTTWPDDSFAEMTWVEPASVPSLFPLIHLEAGDEDKAFMLRHELGHALHFSRLSEAVRVDLSIRYLAWLASERGQDGHCFERRTNPLVAWVEAFGAFAQIYAATTTANAATGPTRHADFFREVATEWQPDLFRATGCEDGAEGPFLGEDVEGAVFAAIYFDYAQKVGLDFVVTTVVQCESLDVRGYAACIENAFGTDSPTYFELTRSCANYGIPVGAMAGSVEDGDRFGSSLARGDFNGDGFQDLAVGVPGEDVGEVASAGAVHIIYGTPAGLMVGANQLWHQDSEGIPGAAEAGDQLGAAVAAGDFDGDGFDDLAIGVPGEDVESIADAGSVLVLYGTRFGLKADSAQTWHQDTDSVPDVSEPGDRFGASLAAGNFNGGAFADLAIGAPAEDLWAIADAGQVTVIYGFAGGLGNMPNGFEVWSAATPGIAGEEEAGATYGAALAAGDFNGDGAEDLAVGAPRATVGAADEAGAVNVIYGVLGFRLIVTHNQLWTQDVDGVRSDAQPRDSFGAALAAGDFDRDGRDDLAIGVPHEDAPGAPDAGAVAVLSGSPHRLTATWNQFWVQGNGIEGVAEAGDLFGKALAAGDIDGDGSDDLVIGVPFEDVDTIVNAGAVAALYGGEDRVETVVVAGRVTTLSVPGGLDYAGNELHTQSSNGVPGSAEAADLFGSALAVGDFNGDGYADAAVGVPQEDVATELQGGAVNVLRGTEDGLATRRAQIWHQDR